MLKDVRDTHIKSVPENVKVPEDTKPDYDLHEMVCEIHRENYENLLDSIIKIAARQSN